MGTRELFASNTSRSSSPSLNNSMDTRELFASNTSSNKSPNTNTPTNFKVSKQLFTPPGAPVKAKNSIETPGSYNSFKQKLFSDNSNSLTNSQKSPKHLQTSMLVPGQSIKPEQKYSHESPKSRLDELKNSTSSMKGPQYKTNHLLPTNLPQATEKHKTELSFTKPLNSDSSSDNSTGSLVKKMEQLSISMKKNSDSSSSDRSRSSSRSHPRTRSQSQPASKSRNLNDEIRNKFVSRLSNHFSPMRGNPPNSLQFISHEKYIDISIVNFETGNLLQITPTMQNTVMPFLFDCEGCKNVNSSEEFKSLSSKEQVDIIMLYSGFKINKMTYDDVRNFEEKMYDIFGVERPNREINMSILDSKSRSQSLTPQVHKVQHNHYRRDAKHTESLSLKLDRFAKQKADDEKKFQRNTQSDFKPKVITDFQRDQFARNLERNKSTFSDSLSLSKSSNGSMSSTLSMSSMSPTFSVKSQSMSNEKEFSFIDSLSTKKGTFSDPSLSNSNKKLSLKSAIEKTKLDAMMEDSNDKVSLSDKIKEMKERRKLENVDNVDDVTERMGGLSLNDRISSMKEKRNKSRATDDMDDLIVSMEKLRLSSKKNSKNKTRNIFDKYKITFVKLFTDKKSDVVYMHGITSNGGHVVVEEHNSDMHSHVDSTHTITKHEGEELDLSKNIIDAECAELGTCGLFTHHGDEIVVSKMNAGELSKTQYLISTHRTMHSVLEHNGVIQIPIVEMHDLESEDGESILAIAEANFVGYNNDALVTSSKTLILSANYANDFKESVYKFYNNTLVANDNFKAMLKILDANILVYTKNGNDEMLESTKEARCTLFDDIRTFITDCNEVERMVEHSVKATSSINDKFSEMNDSLKKYSGR